MRPSIVRCASAAAITAILASSAAAQGYSSAGGIGAGYGGMLGVGLPGAGEPGGVTSTGRNDVGNALKKIVAQLNASSASEADHQVGAVMGQSAPGNVVTLVDVLAAGGVGRSPANSLAKGLSMLGTSHGSYGALIDAAQAFNAAVNSLAAGVQAPAALLAARGALAPLLEAAK